MHRVIQTEDGSPTLYVPELGEHYHSVHGAVQEARHIFLEAGMDAQLAECTEGKLRIIEAGFGTGLNAWLTLLHALEKECRWNITRWKNTRWERKRRQK